MGVWALIKVVSGLVLIWGLKGQLYLRFVYEIRLVRSLLLEASDQ